MNIYDTETIASIRRARRVAEMKASLKAAGMVILAFGVTALLVLAGLWNAGLI